MFDTLAWTEAQNSWFPAARRTSSGPELRRKRWDGTAYSGSAGTKSQKAPSFPGPQRDFASAVPIRTHA